VARERSRWTLSQKKMIAAHSRVKGGEVFSNRPPAARSSWGCRIHCAAEPVVAIGIRAAGRTHTKEGPGNDWRPVPSSGRDPATLRLTPVDAYVLSRIDGATSVAELVLICGIDAPSLHSILERLAHEGAIGPLPAATDAPPIVERPPAAAPDPQESGAPATRGAATHRHLFETTLHALPEEQREARAAAAAEPELSAFCFDPTPRVVRAVLANPRTGLPHARLVAAHHGNAVGLDSLGEKPSFVQDTEVQRLLLRNPQCSAPLLRRLLARHRLADVYLATQSRELPDRNRRGALEVLKRRFAETTPEDRVELVLRTEGRALPALTGLSLDTKAASLLCARTITSIALVENLARWSATPPPVIAHLLKQPMVLRMPHVRNLLKRHPNCPASER
jgi:hypothetical protein